jgi:2-iminobutanoate/2-iminopropanoate deaminase
MKTEVRSQGAPAPSGPYSQAVDAGAVYCSGQIGTDPATGDLRDGIVAQTAAAMANLEAVLKGCGLDLGNVVKTTVFLSDMSDYGKMNEEYSKHFRRPFPARTTVQAAALPRGALVEIDAVAAR